MPPAGGSLRVGEGESRGDERITKLDEEAAHTVVSLSTAQVCVCFYVCMCVCVCVCVCVF
jgi:hypothetical protein